jgi:hypothetical protein
MIEEVIKDRVFGIISYCDTIEKVNVLVNNIDIIRKRFPGYKIALQANYPLSEDIQRSVDNYYYQDLNFIHDDKWIYYWNIIMNPEATHPYFNKKFFYSIQDVGFSVFQQINTITKHLIEYKWMMLINYDTSVEEIRIEDYSTEYDLTVHLFPDGKGASLIIMFCNPQIFYEKVTKNFTYENWVKPERKDQLNEERFFDMINESNISCFGHKYKISDKISGEPDYLKPNAPVNEFFTSYLLYNPNNILEIYLWGLSVEIKNMMIKIHDRLFILDNRNKLGAFEHNLEIPFEIPHFTEIQIKMIDNIEVDIELKIKKGYITRPL